MSNDITTISGPCRGGKSLWAEKLIGKSDSVIYIATGNKNHNDMAWQLRIDKHVERRPANWITKECSTDLTSYLRSLTNNYVLLIDSIGGFVANHLIYSDDKWESMTLELIDCLNIYQGPIYIVIEEVGWGLVSEYRVGNLFRDRLGSLSQQIDKISTNSWLVLQGRAIDLKEIGQKI